ncbi:MAG: MFS transporter [Caldilineaceae bacterium]
MNDAAADVSMDAGAAKTREVSVRDLLRITNFRWLWLGQLISDFGDAITQLTLVLLINRVTGGSTSAIANLLIALALPHATVGLVAGVFVDRWDRKRVMIVSDLLRGILVLAFILVGVHTDGGDNRLWLLYTIAFLLSAVGVFFTPARSAIIPNVVPQEGLLAANTLSQTSMVGVRVVGTAAAGVLVGVLGVFGPAFVIDAITYFVSMLLISRIALAPKAERLEKVAEPVARSGAAETRAILREMRSGFTLIAGSRILVGTLVAIAVTMLGLGAVNVLMAPMVVNDLSVSETWFGAIEFAQVAGMVLSGALVTVLAARLKPTHIVSAGLMGLALGVGLLATIQTVWHLFPLLFFVGLLVTPTNSAISTLIQTEVQDEARGRISAAAGAIVQVASLLSMFAAGGLAALIGVRMVFVVGGLITLLAGMLSAWIFRGYMPKPELETALALQEA